MKLVKWRGEEVLLVPSETVSVVGIYQMMINIVRRAEQMTRKELKEQIDELMRQYADEEIDGITYKQKMIELTTSFKNEIDEY